MGVDMKTKKVLALLMVGAMTFSMAACGGGTKDTSSSDTATTDASEETNEEN